jgi:tRNA (guanine37-N1)-methyltransferase
LLSPTGAPLTQRRVRELARLDHIALVCGRYEGVDERVAELAIDETLSLGDFVMTGGELAAMVTIDAMSRFVPGVLGEAASTEEESFSDGLLEYPQYTRPRTFRGRAVPDVLIGGNHAEIAAWRRRASLDRTARQRPELLPAVRGPDSPLTALAARTWVILAHHPVYDRNRDLVTTAITNLDVHDIARAAATYGLAGYVITTPVEAQREKVARIVSMWRDDLDGVDNRREALSAIDTVPGIRDAIELIRGREGASPAVVATSADPSRGAALPRVGFRQLLRERLAEPKRPLALLFGTGWGLADDAIREANQMLEPIHGPVDFNHLAVRSAVCIVLDRLLGH